MMILTKLLNNKAMQQFRIQSLSGLLHRLQLFRGLKTALLSLTMTYLRLKMTLLGLKIALLAIK